MQEHLFTRDEVLSGFPARQAGVLLFLIESRVAHWTAQADEEMQLLPFPETAEDRDMEFLQAFTSGKEPPLKPTIQNIERFADRWAGLVPANPGLRAAIAQRLGGKYRLSPAYSSGIRQALSLEDPKVQAAFERQFHRPLDSIYASQIASLERLTWIWLRFGIWLEHLPAFWTSYAITLTETVGASILALPIALAGIGPLPGLVLMILFGLLNILTVEYVTETLARTGSVRYEHAYFGRVVSEYLGRSGSIIFSWMLILLQFLTLVAYSIGVSSTLQGATHISAGVWVILLLLVALYFLASPSLHATINSALVAGAVNIVVILVLSFLALPHIKTINLAYLNLPFGPGKTLDPAILNLVFGTIFAAYFGHTATANVARSVLRRDSTGKGLIWGAVAAQITAIILYCLWIVSVNGSIPAALLASQPGTALIPMAQEVGPAVLILGSIFVILGMGMGCVHFSRGCFNLVQERLPRARRPVISLPRRRGRLVFHPPGSPDGFPRLGLVYLGSESERTRFRLDWQDEDSAFSKEFSTNRHWEIALPDSIAGDGKEKIRLGGEVLKTTPESVQIQIWSNFTPTYQGEWDQSGVNITELADFPEDQRRILAWLLRNGVAQASQIASAAGLEQAQALSELKTLQAQGFVHEEESPQGSRYRSLLTFKHKRRLPADIWKTLETAGSRHPANLSRETFLDRLRSWFLRIAQSKQASYWISASPVILIYLFIEWTVLSHQESFSATLSFIGIISVPLLGGIFPVLLLASSRKKGDQVPESRLAFFGNPVFLGLVYLVSLASLLFHGLIIWQDPLFKAMALAIAVIILLATGIMIRQGAFQPRLVVHLFQDGKPDQARLTVTGNGKPFPVEAMPVSCSDHQGRDRAALDSKGKISHFASLCSIHFGLTNHRLHDVKIWAHRRTPEGDSEALPVVLKLRQGELNSQYDLHLTDGKALIRLVDQDCEVEMLLSQHMDGGVGKK